MKRAFIEVKDIRDDNANTIIFVDKIQSVVETKNGCIIVLNGFQIHSNLNFEDFKVMIQALKGGEG